MEEGQDISAAKCPEHDEEESVAQNGPGVERWIDMIHVMSLSKQHSCQPNGIIEWHETTQYPSEKTRSLSNDKLVRPDTFTQVALEGLREVDHATTNTRVRRENQNLLTGAI